MTKTEINKQLTSLKEKVKSKNFPAVIIKAMEVRISDLEAMLTAKK